VISIAPATILFTFLVFCRIGGCLMLMPGFSSPRVPVQVRLFLAIAVTGALAPILVPALATALPALPPATVTQLIASETLTGAVFGLMGRTFLLALQFMGTAAASFMGFTGQTDPPVEESEPAPAVAALLTLTATVVIFAADLHIEVLKALVSSYSVLRVTDLLDVQFALGKLTDASSDAFFLVARLSGPFLVYSLVINFLFGIANKMAPQIPAYFISFPFVLAGGLLLFYFTFGEVLRLFIAGFETLIAAG
jgi:flagellar biosynthetic protein FliR